MDVGVCACIILRTVYFTLNIFVCVRMSHFLWTKYKSKWLTDVISSNRRLGYGAAADSSDGR